MRRLVPILIGVILLIAASVTPVAAARTLPIAFSGHGTATVAGCIEGGSPPCAGTTIVSVSVTISGTPHPFDEIKGFKAGTAVVSGTLLVWNDSFDADTGCYMTMLGSLVVAVNRNQREAFTLDVTGPFCPGGNSGTFEVNPSGTDFSMFRDATGTGSFDLSHGFFDLSAQGTSPAQLNVSGTVSVRR